MKNLILSAKKALSSNEGFSLLELILAVAILSVVFGMTAPALYSHVASASNTDIVRKNREGIVGKLDQLYASDTSGADAGINKTVGTYTVTFPTGNVDLSCTQITSTQEDEKNRTYENIGIVKPNDTP